MSKILCTYSLPYVNAHPHLGTMSGMLAADIYCRFHKSIGIDTLFVCGTDEYGTATETKASNMNMTPRKLCDHFRKLHIKSYDWFNIKFDVFGRTSTPNPKTDDWTHTKITHQIFHQLVNNGFIIEKDYVELYCKELDKSLSDRYVKGTCPNPSCGDNNADGDQCSVCTSVHSVGDLINPYYKMNKSYVLERRVSKELFLRIEPFREQLTKLRKTNELTWSSTANGITQEWLKGDLRDRCITRKLKWGTSVPYTEKFGDRYENRVFYVWFDAPIGYISITADEYPDTYHLWWKSTDHDVKFVNFMAKDNVPFHSIVFPTVLMGTQDNYRIVDEIHASEYINYEGKRFSKSGGVGVFCNDAMDSEIPSDIWRFYLTYIRPETSDSSFKWDDMVMKVNNELVSNFSNVCYRIVTFTHKKFKSIPICTDLNLFNNFNSEYEVILNEYTDFIRNGKIRDSLKKFLAFSTKLNVFLTVHEPWKTIKTNEQKSKNVMSIACHFAVALCKMSYPFIPDASRKLFEMLNVNNTSYKIQFNEYSGVRLKKPSILFTKLDDNLVAKLREKCN